jgi:Lrp/AsnC family transcriptional regulator
MHGCSICQWMSSPIRLKNHDEQALIAFEQAARERPEIMQCFSMSGDSDYLVRW